MSTDPRSFQKSRKPWSRWKHEILINYLKAMAVILGSHGSIYYVDGFAGPGRYLEDCMEGSPLLAAKHAKGLYYSDKEYALHCINVEYDLEVFDNLNNATSAYADWVDNYHGDISELVPAILRTIREKPTLFFLDPIGVKDLAWNDLEPIFERSFVTELLIRFDAQTALRLTGHGMNLHKTFNSVLGEENSSYWLRYLEDCAEGSQAKRACLTDAYENKLKMHFPYVGKIPIMSSDDSLKYYLLFATKNVKGMQVMNDVFFKVQDLRDRTLDEERRARGIGQQMTMFDPSPEQKALHELEVLKQAIIAELDSGESAKRDELRGRVASLYDNFGRFSGSHFTAVLGGRPRGVAVPRDFESLKSRIVIHNRLTPGNDKVEISLKR